MANKGTIFNKKRNGCPGKQQKGAVATRFNLVGSSFFSGPITFYFVDDDLNT
ncbi:hypothetical protein E6C60_0103 [Paenibacillus algicola]|uniref:Uncharacterized protein n=1 Tax=Paenibacillus algicola TaxID=2565926 RepID=A0A4P8XHD2_9BACL|nr:hypothetical protein E6C60_0103 [Paenibacillus algicola]